MKSCIRYYLQRTFITGSCNCKCQVKVFIPPDLKKQRRFSVNEIIQRMVYIAIISLTADRKQDGSRGFNAACRVQFQTNARLHGRYKYT